MKRKNEQTDTTSPDADASASSSGLTPRPENLSPETITAGNERTTHPPDSAAKVIAADSDDAQHAPAERSAAPPEESARTGQPSADAPDVADEGAADINPTLVLPLSPFGPEEWESVELPPVALDVAGSKYSLRLTIHIKEEAPDEADAPGGSRIYAPAAKTRKPKSNAAGRTRQAAEESRMHVCIRRAAFEKLRRTVGSHPPERGGIFVGTDPFLLEDFIFDRTDNPAGAVYFPNTKYLNGVLARDHEPYGRYFIGLAHSHPAGMWHPSGDEKWGDVKAARNNLLAPSNGHLPALFIPIIESTAATGTFAMHAFVMMREGLKLHPADYEIIEGGDAC